MMCRTQWKWKDSSERKKTVRFNLGLISICFPIFKPNQLGTFKTNPSINQPLIFQLHLNHTKSN
jgi:hypothetical protein